MPTHMRGPVAVMFGVEDREVCGWKKMTVWGEGNCNEMKSMRK